MRVRLISVGVWLASVLACEIANRAAIALVPERAPTVGYFVQLALVYNDQLAGWVPRGVDPTLVLAALVAIVAVLGVQLLAYPPSRRYAIAVAAGLGAFMSNLWWWFGGGVPDYLAIVLPGASRAPVLNLADLLFVLVPVAFTVAHCREWRARRRVVAG